MFCPALIFHYTVDHILLLCDNFICGNIMFLCPTPKLWILTVLHVETIKVTFIFFLSVLSRVDIVGPKFRILTVANLRIMMLGKTQNFKPCLNFLPTFWLFWPLYIWERWKLAIFRIFGSVEILGPKFKFLTTGNLQIKKLGKSQIFLLCLNFWLKFWFWLLCNWKQ